MGERSRFKCPKCGSHEEAKRKAAAEALRELAAEIRAETSGPFGDSSDDYDGGWSDAKHRDAEKADARADALWPRRKR